MDNKITNLKDYKKAKIMLKDLENILKVMDLSIRGLKNFKHYVPVAKSLVSLEESKTLLEIYHNKCKNILSKKDG